MQTFEKPKSMYPGKNAPWFVALILLICVSITIIEHVFILHLGAQREWRWLLILLVPATISLCVLPLTSNRVELYDDHLDIVYALSRTTLPYQSIRSAQPTRTLLAAPANSLDRIQISDASGNIYVISTRDNKALINELEKQCPHIQRAEKNKN